MISGSASLMNFPALFSEPAGERVYLTYPDGLVQGQRSGTAEDKDQQGGKGPESLAKHESTSRCIVHTLASSYRTFPADKREKRYKPLKIEGLRD